MLELSSTDADAVTSQSSQQESIRAFLSSLFGQLCTGQGSLSQTGLLQQPWVMATAARLVGDYALWFSKLGGSDVPLEGALRLLLEALQMPQVKPHEMRNGRHPHGVCVSHADLNMACFHLRQQ